MAKEKIKKTNEIADLRLKIIETRARIQAGREKNPKAARKLRKELARKLTEKTKNK